MAEKTSKGSMPPPAENSEVTARNRGPGRPFQPGQSGNPGGRPKSKPFKEALEAVLKAAGPEADLQAIATSLCAQAIAGNVQGIREVADRLDGKVPQAIAGIDENEQLIPLAAAITLGRTQPRPPSKAVDGVRKPSDRDLIRRGGRRG